MYRRQLTLTLAIVTCLSAVSPTLAQDARTSAKERTDALLAVLNSNAPRKEKHDACRHLAVIGDPRSVPVLAGMLGDAKLSHMARYALETIGDPSVDVALRAAMGTLKGRLRVGVINSIGMRRDVKAVDALTRLLLLTGTDADDAAAAAAALGQIATPQAVRALGEFRKIAPAPLRAVAADASLAAAERLVAQGRGKDALGIYEELQAGTWPAHVRLGAFAGSLAADTEKGPARLIQAITGKDATLRAVAIARIDSLKGPNVTRRFAAELPKLPPETQVLLIGVLARRGDPSARPAVIKAASHADAKVRTAALQAIGALGDAGSVELLIGVAAGGRTDPEKRAALASLRALKGPGVDAAIIRRLGPADPVARAGLIDVLVVRKTVAAVPALIAQAKTGSPEVRAAAFKALGKLATPKDLPALLGLLVALKDDAARSEAQRAAIIVARQIPDASARADAALAALKSATATPARCSLLRVLGGIGNAKALAAVGSAFKDSQADVRETAVRALADWPEPNALETLLTIFRTTDNRTHRVLALRGAVRLLEVGGSPVARRLRTYTELLRTAKRVEDERLVLAGLANVAEPAALAAIEPFLSQADVRGEAELAYLKVARAIMGSARKPAVAAARKLIKEAKSASVRKAAEGIIAQVERFEDYIVAWQVAGPYRPGGKIGRDLFRAALPPEKPGARNVSWRPLPAGGGAQPWMFDLGGGSNRACCVRTWVHVDKRTGALLEFGTDDGNKVYLNGKVVHANGGGGAAIPGEHKVKVTLNKGWNAVLMKVTQQTGPWQFCFRIRSPDGSKLPGLKVRATEPEPE